MKRATRELRRKKFDLFTLFEIANAMAGSVDPEKTLRTILLTSLAQAGTGLGGLFTVDALRTKLRLALVRGSPRPLSFELPLNGPFLTLLARRRSPVFLEEAANRPVFRSAVRPLVEMGFVMGVPLEWNERLSGFLVLGRGRRDQKGYPPDVQRVLTTLAAFAAAVLERDRLLQEIRQAEKLSALGQMTTGIAHELNNPIGAILGYVQLAARAKRPDPDQLTRDMAMIRQQAERALHILQGLTTFSRRRPLDRHRTDLYLAVRAAVESARKESRFQGVEVELALEGSSCEIHADPHALEQVFINLLNNGADAVKGRKAGRIRVASKRVSDAVHVTVEDNGSGMAEADLPKLFDPFFTTKPVGEGTGLGLSICHSLVAQHGGRLLAENLNGGGAAFTVVLPT